LCRSVVQSNFSDYRKRCAVVVAVLVVDDYLRWREFESHHYCQHSHNLQNRTSAREGRAGFRVSAGTFC